MTNYEELLKRAKEVSKNAYTPYSKFNVGACVLAESGNMYVGCNFENSSYGMSICAERNAIGTAIANGEKKIVAIAIYSPNKDNCPPCGACRQVMYEFQGEREIEIITEEKGELNIKKMSDFLPFGFKIQGI